MIREVVQCEECGVGGLDPAEDVCGDWIGTSDNGYSCPDILCRDCRGVEEAAAMQKTPRGPYYTQDPGWYDARRLLILKARREGQTFAAIGDDWGVTKERVRQIILKELRRRSHADS